MSDPMVAEATQYFWAEVSGRIELFFFDIEGKVTISFGDNEPALKLLPPRNETMLVINGELVAVSLGRPSSSSGMPADAAFVSYVLVLREFIHHLAFGDIGVEEAASCGVTSAGASST